MSNEVETKMVPMSFLLSKNRMRQRHRRAELGCCWRRVVYEVSHPKYKHPLYIGSTMYTPTDRLRQHLHGENGKTRLGRFIKHNGYEDLNVTLYAAADQPSLRQLERELIAERRPLFNE